MKPSPPDPAAAPSRPPRSPEQTGPTGPAGPTGQTGQTGPAGQTELADRAPRERLDRFVRLDPYPGYARLREEAPIYYSEPAKSWLVTRYKDVLTCLREPRLSSQRMGFVEQRLPEPLRTRALSGLRHLESWALMLDPPQHTRLRQLMNKAFTAKRIETMRPRVQQLIDELLERSAAKGRMDVVHDFANLVPVRVIGDMLGLPAEDGPRLKLWSDGVAAFLGAGRYAHAVEDFITSMSGLEEYFRTAIAARRRRPGDDLLTLLLTAEEEGKIMSEHELIATCTLLLFGGHETTTNLIGNGVQMLLEHPEAQAELRAAPHLIGPAVEEFLRYQSPVQRTGRIAAADLELSGQRIDKGQMIFLLLGAANRDPAQFAEPDTLQLQRPDNRHLAFGLGSIHFCVGAALARLEGQLAIATLLRRFPCIERAPTGSPSAPHGAASGARTEPAQAAAAPANPEWDWSDNIALRGLVSLPIVMRGAAA